ncbi:MAG: DUF4258 domain-containing protein, partial [Chloroflexi bacterium]|nr:DUF4258 domain-containing protein [Chloroflexota bacterium]
MDRSLPDRLREALRTRSYRLTQHAEQEREADTITIAELSQAFGSAAAELLEDYPTDPRGHSALFLGFTSEDHPLHAVVGFADPGTAVFVTVYRPDPKEWYDWR